MPNDKTIELINILCQKTIQRAIKWECTREEDLFKAFFDGASLAINQHWDSNEGEHFQVLEIFNEDGKIIDQVYSMQSPEYTKSLYNLFQAARGNALKAEETYEKLLGILNQNKIKQPKNTKDDIKDDSIPF